MNMHIAISIAPIASLRQNCYYEIWRFFLKLNLLLRKIIHELRPQIVIHESLRLHDQTLILGKNKINLHRYPEIHLIGLGKAACSQVKTIGTFLSTDKRLRSKIKKGLCLTKYQHGFPSRFYDFHESAHPISDKNSLKSGLKLKTFLRHLKSDSLLIVCLSGGASALVIVPRHPFTLKDKTQASRDLIRSGAKIQQINQIRKEMSEIKNKTLSQITNNKAASIDKLLPVSYVQKSPTLYSLNIPQGNRWLAFSESFDPQWQLVRSTDGKTYSPVPMFDLLNGFYVDTPGEYTLEYLPQRYVLPGMIISLSTLTILIGIFIVFKYANKRISKHI